jgi:hypothetical protein
VVNGCEGNLRSDLMAEILEHVAIKVFGIVNRDLLRDTVMIDDILPELFDGCKGYVGDRLRLNPFHEILGCHNGDVVIVMRYVELVDYVNAPSLKRPRWSD